MEDARAAAIEKALEELGWVVARTEQKTTTTLRKVEDLPDMLRIMLEEATLAGTPGDVGTADKPAPARPGRGGYTPVAGD